jgi:hypothetical protein
MRQKRLKLLLALLGVLLACLVFKMWRAEGEPDSGQTMTPLAGTQGHVVVDRVPGSDRKVVSLVFIDRPVTDQELSCLRAAPPFQRLFLDGTKVTDEGLDQVGEFPGLLWLSLCNTAVTDRGLERLKGLPNLEALFLKGCRGVTDRGLEHLKGMRGLRVLALDGTRVTPAAEGRLQKELPELNVLRARPDDD